MQDTRAARRYAQALFDVAKKHGVVSSVEDDLANFSGILHSNGEFRQFFLAPYTSRPEKIAIVDKMFSDRITALSLELIRLMLSKGREHEIDAVREEFVRLRRKEQGIIHVVVTTATPLTPQQQTLLLTKLRTRLSKEIEAEYELDPKGIGGVKVAFGDSVIDGTIRGSLAKLRDQFRHDVLKQA